MRNDISEKPHSRSCRHFGKAASGEGDVSETDGSVRVTAIRITYRLKIPAGTREKAERALETYSKGCPAYLTIKDCVETRWTAELEEA